jgi:hypothetical protein
VGYIGGTSSAKKRGPSDVEKGVKDYIYKKYESKKIRSVVVTSPH